VVGSPENPVVIVSAAAETHLAGNFSLFGVLYVFDGEVKTAEFTAVGRSSIYGALIVDAGMEMFSGTVDIVYAEGVLRQASDLGGFGAINGGWRDFGLPDVAW
jgi:hypothetical protein